MCLDQIYRQLWFADETSLLLVSGRKISEENFASYFDPGAQKIAEELMRLTKIYKKLRIDRTELICLMMFSMFILDERVGILEIEMNMTGTDRVWAVQAGQKRF